jgi:hypothetical protein
VDRRSTPSLGGNSRRIDKNLWIDKNLFLSVPRLAGSFLIT